LNILISEKSIARFARFSFKIYPDTISESTKEKETLNAIIVEIVVFPKTRWEAI
jgi:hypothetical protein